MLIVGTSELNLIAYVLLSYCGLSHLLFQLILLTPTPGFRFLALLSSHIVALILAGFNEGQSFVFIVVIFYCFDYYWLDFHYQNFLV